RSEQQTNANARGPVEVTKKGLLGRVKGAFSNSSDEWKSSAPKTAPPAPAVPPELALVSVTVLSKPAGATIFVDGYPAGRTPTVVKLMPGTYKFTLKAEGFPD